MIIDSFWNEYRFLSNFAPSLIVYEGIDYPTVEHAYQAAKTNVISQKWFIASRNTPGAAKRAGQDVILREDWEDIKIDIMRTLVRTKFEIPELREKLIATGQEILIEGNTWGDTFWGEVKGLGQNWLGKILMEIRDEINERTIT